MKRKLRLLFPVVAACFALSGCDFISINNAGEDGAVSGYYKKYNLKLSGPRLAQELQKMCFDKHTHWVKYGELANYYVKTSDRNSTDAIADGESKIQWFYTAKETTDKGTREHVWPCANSSDLWYRDSSKVQHQVEKTSYVGGGSDLYHVRPCDGTVNSLRGNSTYVDYDDEDFKDIRDQVAEIGDGGPYKLKYTGASTNETTGKLEFAKKTEPDDTMKGDIARIITYLWVHYTERGTTPTGGVQSGQLTYNYSDMTGGLSLTAVIGYDTLEKCQKKLKEWNEMDPPSDVEKLRNDTVQKIQGNRNPFVDYPDLVAKVFNIK